MAQKVVLVGHCGADSAYLRLVVSAASKGASVVAVDDEKSLQQLIDGGADLLLINRRLDYGFNTSQGVALIQRLRGENQHLKMMLVSNYPDAQQAAIAAGALPGFGKSQIGSQHVKEMLRAAIS